MPVSRRSALKAVGAAGGLTAASGTVLAVGEHEDDERTKAKTTSTRTTNRTMRTNRWFPRPRSASLTSHRTRRRSTFTSTATEYSRRSRTPTCHRTSRSHPASTRSRSPQRAIRRRSSSTGTSSSEARSTPSPLSGNSARTRSARRSSSTPDRLWSESHTSRPTRRRSTSSPMEAVVENLAFEVDQLPRGPCRRLRTVDHTRW